MKKMMFLLMMICLSASSWAQTVSGTCGKVNAKDITWSYDTDTKTLTISGTGDMKNYVSGTTPWNAYLSSITSVVIESGVTSIGNYAFSTCSGLKSVSIPDGVTSIGTRAFQACSGLTFVSIPNSVTSIANTAFDNCTALTSVGIPSSVTSIESNTFYNCSALTSVSIPNSVTSIGSKAFSSCRGLQSISIPSSVTSIGLNAFSSCSRLKDVYYNTTTPMTYDTRWALVETTQESALTLHVPVGATTDAFSGWASEFAAVKYDIVDVTAVSGHVYTGSEQTGVLAATGYTVTDGAKTDAGNYTATASLVEGYVWPDGTTAPKTIAWSIAQATNAWTTQPSIADYAYGATPSTPAGTATFGTPEFGYYTEEACTNAVDLTNGKPTPGTYYMKASVAGTGNYTALSKVVAFHITNQIVTLSETGTDNGLTDKDAVKSDVTYARTFTVGNWSTICLPFALTSAQMDAAFGGGNYEVAKLESVSSGVLSFTKVTDMAAGTPYIIKFTTAPASTTLTFKDVTIDKTDRSFFVGTGETCTMTGTSAVTLIQNNANHYIMQGNKIYRVATDNVKMAAFRAYLTYSEGSVPSPASALTFDVDGETTGIADVSVDSNYDNDTWYTLGGQKLSEKPVTNGIYISNGRKIVIK
jgi:hypothetical protein